MNTCPIPEKSRLYEVQSQLDVATNGEFSRLLDMPCPVVSGGKQRNSKNHTKKPYKKPSRTRKAIYGGSKLKYLARLVVLLIVGSEMYSNCSADARKHYISDMVCPIIADATKLVNKIPEFSMVIKTRKRAGESVLSIVNDVSTHVAPFLGRFFARNPRNNTVYRAGPSPIPPVIVSATPYPYPGTGPYPAASPTYSTATSYTYSIAPTPTDSSSPSPIPDFTVAARSKPALTVTATPRPLIAAPSYGRHTPSIN
jgi:hypothetical protein